MRVRFTVLLTIITAGLSIPSNSPGATSDSPTSTWPNAPSLRTWDLEPKPVVVAVIDTGLDIKHPRLARSIWVNPGETGFDSAGRDKGRNGVDDDKNGFIDDVNGWNFHGESNDLEDRQGHGTHIAGLIVEAAGRTPIRLMPLKFFDMRPARQNSLDHAVAALAYAIQMKVDIINFSAGGRRPSDRERSLLSQAERLGILVVAAAGNDGLDADRDAYYPAAYPFENIISVTSVDAKGQLSRFANRGRLTVDLAAVGEDVLSLSPGGGLRRMSGSSQATATVTGRAAYWRSVSGLNASEIRQRLILEGRSSQDLHGKTRHALWLASPASTQSDENLPPLPRLLRSPAAER